MMKTVKEFKNSIKEIEKIQSYITEMLKRYKISNGNIALSLLTIEEYLTKFVENKSSNNDKIRVKIKKGFFNVILKITCPGTELNIGEIYKNYDSSDPEIKESLNNLANKIFNPSIEYVNKYGINKIIIPIRRAAIPRFVYVIIALFAAIPVGLLLKNFAPSYINTFLIENVFGLFNTAFLQMLRFLLAPLVFLSIASSIASISDLSKLGKVAIKISIGYIFTSILALFASIIPSRLFYFKNNELANIIVQNSQNVSNAQVGLKSFKENILDIIPTDVITPFLNLNMLQLIFFAIIFGITLSAISKKNNYLLDIIETLNIVFMKIISKIVIVVPIYVFFSITQCMIKLNFTEFANVFIFLPATITSFAIMLVIYGIIIALIGKLNPIKFFKKVFPTMLTAFSLSSSSATIPETLKSCKKLGISEKVYTFSIPFGATINMDGVVVEAMVAVLLFLNLLNIHLPTPTFIAFCASLVLLSAGLPGIPNASIMIYTIIFNMVGIPVSAVSFIVAVASIIEMFSTLVNVTGDMAMTVTVASTEKMIDLKKYNN